MKFLVDAQLPQQLARWLKSEGHDIVHTLDLPAGNRTTDEDINELSLSEQRIVVTKDGDFVDTFLLRRAPYRLLLVSAGNISNADLLKLVGDNIADIDNAFETCEFVELGQGLLIVHY